MGRKTAPDKGGYRSCSQRVGEPAYPLVNDTVPVPRNRSVKLRIMLFAFTWPPVVLLLAYAWAFYESVQAARLARQGDRNVDRDVFWLSVAVAGLSAYWFAANVIRWVAHLGPAVYLDMVSPLTLVVVVVVWVLPRKLYRMRTINTRRALEIELAATKQIAESLSESAEVDSE
jgi:hypothetical protein